MNIFTRVGWELGADVYECCELCHTEYVDIYLAAGDCSCMTLTPVSSNSDWSTTSQY